ncbi:hypothetical protein GM415_12125 [Pseudodesulfovibrio cashew]|uniref:Carboxymuconolactone decarboxylase family protein n=1 Tax=Pseudodesulfovibrio cashew TaxID=2678688 RepID=A0A6I6JF84_9BACT|nr:hypothetical protein [Pseudodesulfovibrio cashew]QGY40841.1 hypothetical protein GM415_12125 [Pseudodesulfovibrio cashew]
MFLIDYVDPEKAEGVVGDAYSFFPAKLGVPAAVQLYSASPKLLDVQIGTIKYLAGQEELSFHLLAAIRLLAARHYCHDYCVSFNSGILAQAGLSKEEIDRLDDDPAAGFEEKEAALLGFVSKALTSPQNIGEKDVDALRALGWQDTSIFDAMAQAAQMAGASLVFRTFSK